MRVFERKVLRRIFGPEREEMTGGWKKLHNEKFRHLCFLQHIIMTIKLGRMSWKRLRHEKSKNSVGKSEERNHLEDLNTDSSIILKCLIKRIRGCRLYSSASGQAVASSCQHGSNSSDSIKDTEFLN
jgi:hypothetical protein